MASKLRVDEIISNNSNVAIGTATFTGNVTGSTASFTGSVGIGTDNPDRPLHVFNGTNDANVKISSTGSGKDARLELIGNSTGTSQIRLGDEASSNVGLITYDHSDNSLELRTSSAERLRISSAGAIGLGGTNYGTAGQVIKSNGTDAAPTWQNLHQFMFFGEQDTEQTIATGTYSRIENLGTNGISVGDSSIASFDESIGRLTIGADGAGYYYLQMNAGIDDIQAGDFVQVVISKNGNTNTTSTSNLGTRLSTYSRGWNSTGANQVATTSTSCIALLAASDYVQFYVYHQEGTDESTEANRCSVMGYKL